MSFTRHVTSEIRRFTSLSTNVRMLFFSTFLYDLANPVSFTFANAFLFSVSGNNTLVALYNLGMFITVPLGFTLNGYLLRLLPFKFLISSGVILQGFATLALYYWPNLNPLPVFVLGMLLGLTVGLYFGNRNFLTHAATTDDQRTYYGGLEQILSMYVNVIIPVLIGLTINSVSRDSGQVVEGYRLVGIIALLLFTVTAFVLWSIEVKNPTVKKVSLVRVSPQWLKVRVLETFLGIENGLEMFVPGLIVLTFLGGVEILGTMTSLSAAIGAVVIYMMTSRISAAKRAGRFFFFVCLKIALTFIYTLLFSKEAAWMLILCAPSLMQLKWPLQQAQVLKVLDDEEGGDNTNNYAYVADMEAFLNLGRIIGVGMFFMLGAMLSQQTTLRFLPLASTTSQLGVAFIVFSLAKHSYKHLKN